MTVQLDTAWPSRARALADLLETHGDLADPAWKAAVADTPRHVFVPKVYEQDTSAEWRPVEVTSPDGLDRVYSPATLVTKLADRGTHKEGISSSTKPDLMVRMLELLEVRDGNRVLEIGTGTGYNAGLLAHRLGDERVFSVDLDADLVDPARDRLASIGRYPTLVTRDGAAGLAEHAPFDRISATCSVPTVPQAWREQLADGGLLLTDLKIGTGAGNLVLLRRDGDRLEGRFTQRWAAFMLMRHEHEQLPEAPAPTTAEEHTRLTNAPPKPWDTHRVVWFLAHLNGLPGGSRFGMRLDPDTREATASTLTAPDGSQALVMHNPATDGSSSVTESGPTPLWSAVERAYDMWERCGRPGWERVGVTVNGDGTRVWVDGPDGPSWRLS